MAERYTRLASLPENQYAVGSPILITAGALLKDNQTGKALAQVKFKNISEKQIKAIKISVSAFDVSGKELDGVAEYQYLDLTAARTAEFGHKQAVTLPDAVTRSIEVKCTAVFFADGTVWNAEPNAIWTSLPTQKSVTEQLGDLAAQYQRDTSYKSKFIPIEHEDLWLCSCGEINHGEELTCNNCCHNKVVLFDALDMDTLQQRDAAHRAAEAERAEKQAVADKVQRAKTAKFTIIAAVVIAIIVSASLLTTKVIIPNGKYNNAVKLMDAGKYEEAVDAFLLLGGYKDSADKILECKYNHAVELMDSGKYDEAIIAFEALNGKKDSASMIDECNYLAAIALVDSDEYAEALTVFKALAGYKDSDVKIENCYASILGKEVWSALKKAKVGDYVFFGAYEQDNNKSNGREDIEWLVLSKKGTKILVISKNAIDCKQYNTSQTDVTWETCSLRNWLNSDFLNEAFSLEEQALIPTITVTDQKSYQYAPEPGNDTQDKAFLLSSAEASLYFDSDDTRLCYPTAYAKAKGLTVHESSGNCWWWLRSPGINLECADNIAFDGSVHGYGYRVSSGYGAIRPALWIDLGP